MAKANKDVPFIGGIFHRNINIPSIILDFYYGEVQQPSKRSDVDESYVGRLNWYNQPYRVRFYGAYINMGTYDLLQMYQRDRMPPYDLVSQQEVDDGLKRFAEGFKYGYYNFEKDHLNSNPFQDDLHKAQIIFDFISKRMFGGGGTLPISFGLNRHYFAEWKNVGIEAGKRYRAWYLILENNTLFTPLFEKLREERRKGQLNIIERPTLKLSQIALIHVFNGLSITRQNGDEIAKQYGHTSGEKLFQLYSKFSNSTDRKVFDTQRKFKNKIELFKSVLDQLEPNGRERLEKEIMDLELKL